MKYGSGYLEILLKQCESVKDIFENKTNNFTGSFNYSEICKRLTKDFLPPIEREDIAAISYALLEIGRRSLDFYSEGGRATEEIKEQVDALPRLTADVIEKKKTYGEDIRRLVNINFKCGRFFEKSGSQAGMRLNNSFRDYILAVQTAYFKNL